MVSRSEFPSLNITILIDSGLWNCPFVVRQPYSFPLRTVPEMQSPCTFFLSISLVLQRRTLRKCQLIVIIFKCFSWSSNVSLSASPETVTLNVGLRLHKYVWCHMSHESRSPPGVLPSSCPLPGLHRAPCTETAAPPPHSSP